MMRPELTHPQTSDETVRIKLCGLRTREDVDAVNAVLPEYTGFIFDPTRKRYIAPEQAEELRRRLDPRIRPVGVFVNAGVSEILGVLERCRLDAVQLHGRETEADILALREAAAEMFSKQESREATAQRLPHPEPENTAEKPAPERRLFIIKAFRIDSSEDVRRAEASPADMILLDHGPGGTGEVFDWSLLAGCRRPFMLAGGLTPDNVQAAIACCSPWGVDASSSLETDGRKDPEKIRRFVQSVRGLG